MKRDTTLVLGLALAAFAFLPACSSDDSNTGGGSSTTPTVDSGSTPDSGTSNETPDSSTSTPIVDASLNFDVSISCTKPSDCGDSGEVCCGSASLSGVSSSCQSSCTSGQGQLCTSAADCPTGDTCTVYPVVNVGLCAPGTDAAAAPDSGPSSTDASTD